MALSLAVLFLVAATTIPTKVHAGCTSCRAFGRCRRSLCSSCYVSSLFGQKRLRCSWHVCYKKCSVSNASPCLCAGRLRNGQCVGYTQRYPCQIRHCWRCRSIRCCRWRNRSCKKRCRPSPSPSPTSSSSKSASPSPSSSPTSSVSISPTSSFSPTSSISQSPSLSASITPTTSATPTSSISQSPSQSASITPSTSATPTWSLSPSPTQSASVTPTITTTPSPSISVSPSRSPCADPTFTVADWTFSGPNALDGTSTNGAASSRFPVGSYSGAAVCGSDLVITGVIDGPLPGGLPKLLELKATADIPDLSIYGVGSANNGGGTDGIELMLFGSATANQFLYIASEGVTPQNYLGVTPNFLGSVMQVNGDDAFELFKDGVLVDIFGIADEDGTGQAWEYLDGWAYRRSQ